MKVIKELDNNKLEIQDLAPGEVFLYGDETYLLCDCSEIIPPNKTVAKYGAELRTGNVYKFAPLTEVIPLETTTFYKTRG